MQVKVVLAPAYPAAQEAVQVSAVPLPAQSCETYVALNFIHHLMNSIHHLNTHFYPQTLIGPFSAVSRPIAAFEYSFEST